MEFVKTIDSPLGRLELRASRTALVASRFVGKPEGSDDENPVLSLAHAQLREYFAGERAAFDLPIEWHGASFHERVWKALLAIPLGATRSYREIARAVGSPAAVRAVGSANRRNPLAIVVPCHRVIGSDGSLTGYAGGIDKKKWLLDFERQQMRGE